MASPDGTASVAASGARLAMLYMICAVRDLDTNKNEVSVHLGTVDRTHVSRVEVQSVLVMCVLNVGRQSCMG